MRHEEWMYDRTWAEVDLSALADNMEAMKASLPEGVSVIGVVKTDGYGHGAVPVAACIAPYVCGYAVAAVEEALALRREGIQKPILILGPVRQGRYEELIRNQIRPAMFRREELREFGAAAKALGLPGRVHLAVDTGMSRIGMEPSRESARMAAEAASFPGLEIEGMFTHFAKADEKDKTSAMGQLERFLEFRAMLGEEGLSVPVCHCSNSAGIVEAIGTGLSAVRAGISIYGLYPSGEVGRERVKLRPALSWKARVTYVKTVQPGAQVSYGGTFTAVRPTVVATVAAGYGDGYPRSLSGVGWVLVKGRRAPILGRVCMDQMMVDVTEIPGVSEGDHVTLLGRDGGEELSAETLADLSGGFHYEVLCGIGRRVPRIYLKNGAVVGVKDFAG